ncbi:MAG: HIT family protein [Tepidisphaeraceae bacterium]|jgi:histidine triad (HIT) family protein
MHFCQIVSGELPASIVHRDELRTCFMDTQPVNPGHVLVVPNQHVAHLRDMPEDVGMHVFRMAQRMSEALRQTDLRCEGVNLFLADGEAAMQEIPHVHLHVFPRFRGDGFGLKFGDHYFNKPDRTQLDSAARKLAGVFRR